TGRRWPTGSSRTRPHARCTTPGAGNGPRTTSASTRRCSCPRFEARSFRRTRGPARRWRPSGRNSPRTATSTGSGTTPAGWRRPRAPSSCAVSSWRSPAGSRASASAPCAGSSATVPPAGHRGCTPRSSTSSNGSCVATSRRRSCTPCCSSARCGSRRGRRTRTAAQSGPSRWRRRSMTDRRIAVVTGGTAGIGRATVRAFARKGYDVAVLARGPDGLQATVAEIEKAGGRGLAVQTDVADAEATETAAAQVTEQLGPIDVWVNNAFVGAFAYFQDLTPEEFRRITEVTYLGQVNGTRAALKRMRERDRGSIVNVSSALAYQGIPLQSAYCGAKHAIVGFTESVRIELKHQHSPV